MWWILIFSTISAVNEGLKLYPCGDEGYQDVVENTSLTFHCDQYTGSVDWRYKAPTSNSPTTVSTCPAPGSTTSCTASVLPSVWTVTWISATNSSLTTSRTARDPAQSGGEYQCDTAKCGLHVIVPAVVSQPKTNITRQDNGYNVSVSADVTRVYSSRGLYSCDWQFHQLGTVNVATSPDLDPPASNTSNTADRSGRCDVTMPLPSNSGDVSCSVRVSPGNTQRSCDTITITPPSPPTITCPNDVIAENTSISCTCNTSNIGQPGGRLRWYTGNGSEVITEVLSGNYDVSSLSVTWRVSRADHNVRKFRCVNNWMVNITAQNNYTAQVAWGPDAVSIQGNTTVYTDNSSSQSVTLTCQGSQVNPTSALNYTWNVPCDVTQQSTCTLKPRPPGPGDSGDVNRTITCTVTNMKNNNKQQQGSVTLDLKYPPWSAPQINASANTQALHPNSSLTLNCTVSGGDPVVTSVSLTCPGRHEQNQTSGQSSSLVISPVIAADHNLTCVCRGHWVRESYYTLTSSRTLIVYYAPTSSTLLVNNNVSVTLNESEAVTLMCQSRGVPAPRLELLQRDVQLAQQDGGSLPEERSQVSHSAVARCNNTGTVTCRADNGVGDGQQTSVQLYVNCKPRGSTVQPDPPEVNFITTSVNLSLHLEAFPLPHILTFQYLGNSTNTSNSQAVPASIVLSVSCTNTFADYAVRCDIIVHNVSNSSAEGFYTFTAANAFGEEQIVFSVKVNDSTTTTASITSTTSTTNSTSPTSAGSSSDNTVALGVGLGVGLAIVVIAVIIVVCIVYRRRSRRNDKAKKAMRSSHGMSRLEPDGQKAVAQKPPKSTNKDAALTVDRPVTTPQPQSGPSAAPAEKLIDEQSLENLYAEVKKPKTTSPPQALSAGPDAGSDTYNVLDRSMRNPAVSLAPAEPAASGSSKSPQGKTTVNVVRLNPPRPPRPAPSAETTVYENHAFEGDDSTPPATAVVDGSGRTVNPDGLVYTTPLFQESQSKKGVIRGTDKTDYSQIDFSESRKKKSK